VTDLRQSFRQSWRGSLSQLQEAWIGNRINLRNRFNLPPFIAELAGGEWIKSVFQNNIIEHNCLDLMLKTADVDTPFVLCRHGFFFHTEIEKI